jgi:hypothetical protein
MIQKKYFVISVASIYIGLTVLFNVVCQTIEHDRSCYFERPCVRFSCENKKLCDQKYIDSNFNASLLPDDEYIGWNASQGIKAYFGKPKCILNAVDFEENWEFELVNNVARNFANVL